MDAIGKEWKDRFENVWHLDNRGRYRQGSSALRYAQDIISFLPQNAVVNDYGSGTGRAEVEIHKLRPDVKINMIDIADVALEDEARALIGENITYTITDLAKLPQIFPIADWGICINVLMTVSPAKLDTILNEIHRTCFNLYAEVYERPDVRCGIDLTTVKGDKIWWMEKLRQVWKSVELITKDQWPDRYFYICKKNS